MAWVTSYNGLGLTIMIRRQIALRRKTLDTCTPATLQLEQHGPRLRQHDNKQEHKTNREAGPNATEGLEPRRDATP